MGFFSTESNISNLQQVQQITSIMPAGAVQQINSGIIPNINTTRIVLSNNERCHYAERAILITQKITKHIEGQTGSISFRVCKGVTLRTGGFRGNPVQDIEYIQTKGILYITDKRVIFSASKNAFDKRLRYLSTVIPYTDGVQLQFGNNIVSIYVPDGSIVAKVISLVNG